MIGLQWGDEGKGKIVDYYADNFEGVVRYNGGSNAGHTIVIGNKTYIFHLLPSGSLKRKKLFIGPGVALDPTTLKEEIELVAKEGLSLDLTIDGKCTVVTPLDKEMDAFIERMRGDKALGTTKRGIGPSYAMRALRLTPRVMDLVIGKFDFESAKSFYGLFGAELPDLDSWVDDSRSILDGRVGDVGEEILEMNEAGKGVIFEGAQGVLLDLIHGTYPYVTGAHTLASYAPASLGIPSSTVPVVMGVAKAYTTRVGSGPLPTEVPESLADAIRNTGREYGATTGRPRRIGWIDVVALRYAVRMNGVTEIALTKLDVLTKVKELKVSTAYLLDGSEVSNFSSVLSRIDDAKPVYQDLAPLWGATLNAGTIPAAAEKLIALLEQELKVKVRLVSVGEERSATIRRYG